MQSLTDGRKVLQPDKIDKLSTEERFGATFAERNQLPDFRVPHPEPTFPSPLMQRLGFTRRAEFCDHIRKRFRTRWVCMDCGMDLTERG